MKIRIYPWIVYAATAGLWLLAENGRAQTGAASAAAVPSAQVGEFTSNNLAGMLQPLYTEGGSTSGGNATAAPKAAKAGAKGKKKGNGKKRNPEAGVPAPANDAEDDFAGTEVAKISLDTRKQLVALGTQLSAQAAGAPAGQQAAYQQAAGLVKIFNAIVTERDKQVAAVEGVLKTRATNDDADTGDSSTGRAARNDAVAAKEKAAAEENDNLQNLENGWEKTAAGYQQQVDYQLNQLRVLEQKAQMTPAAPAKMGT